MIERYSAPQAEALFSEQAKIERWRTIAEAYAMLSLEKEGDIDLVGDLINTPTPKASAVRTREQTTGHDVVAFLSMFTQDMEPRLQRHIHRGLTSSDLVDTGHHMALAKHAGKVSVGVNVLIDQMRRWENQETLRAGRTHGQLAAPTTWNHQMHVHIYTLHMIQSELMELGESGPVKSPGPTGHPVQPCLRKHAAKVADRFEGYVMPSTQIIPRDHQLRWASVYLRLACALENLALLVRLGSRSEVDEVREGATTDRVGSSAMPHKKNPIDSEKVCGLARVARGYFATIAENTAFWEDRDLTNSSVERIAVPDLAATVEHMVQVMTNIISNLELDFATMREKCNRSAVWTATAQTLLQKYAVLGPVEAGGVIRDLNVPPNSHYFRLRQQVYIWLVENCDREAADRWVDEYNDTVHSIL